jgi:hypothetical protein
VWARPDEAGAWPWSDTVTDRTERKRAIAEYKGRKRRAGVFAVRCAETGHVWVGASPNLDAAKNGLWFVLRSGSARNAELQAEWQAHGEAAFSFEVLEALGDDVAPMLAADELKQKKRDWAGREGAGLLLP